MRAERVNRRLCLAHHRVVSRVLPGCSLLLGEARAVVAAWRDHPAHPGFADDWAALLAEPVNDIRHEITDRTPAADRLRAVSPFALVQRQLMTPPQVHRLWRLAAGRALRILPPAEYAAYARHLKRLPPDDLLLRFWSNRTDAWIDSYVGAIGDDGAVIGHHDERGELDGAIHVSVFRRGAETLAEIGVSVLPDRRRQGLGSQLLQRATLWARNHGASRLYTVSLGANRGMAALAASHNAHIDCSDGEVEAVIAIEPTDTASVALELIENQIGEWDYGTKQSDAGAGPCRVDAGFDHRRLLRLADVGDSAALGSYLTVLRYRLGLAGAGPVVCARTYAAVRASLQPHLGGRPQEQAFVRALPADAGLAA